MKNCSNIGGKIFPSHICRKWDIYWQKTCWGCRINFKFGTQANHLTRRKKNQNNFFIRGPQHCENGIWNIQIFFTFFHNLKIFDVRFEASVQLVPTILFTSFLQPASIETDPIANPPSAVDHIQLVPKYISKVKLERGWSPNILSEIMRCQENGSRGKHFAKFP